jgi:hypothetical protein
MNYTLACASLVLCMSSSACDQVVGPRYCTVPLPEFSPEMETAMFSSSVMSLGAAYKDWHRVDDGAHWAPEACRAQASTARLSASEDAGTHGGKLYFLYAKDRAAYMASATKDQPLGQVIVKDSWMPEEASPSEVAEASRLAGGHGFAERNGKFWKAGEKTALFVMMKPEGVTVGLDEGWVYATTNADGTVVHEAGRLSSCMGCHVEGTRDRMFGLKD